MDPFEEQQNAQSNFTKLVKHMPERLSMKEDGFLETIQREKVNPLKKLASLYSMMDEISKYTSRFTPCKKGCSACCNYNVAVSEIDVEYIEMKTKFSRNAQIKQSTDHHGMPCIFLENGSCQIYEARPFVCRRHHTLTKSNYWCESGRSNIYEFPRASFSSINGAYDFIRAESNSFEVYDIRQVFAKEDKN